MSFRRNSLRALLAGAIAASFSSSAHAAIFTWDGQHDTLLTHTNDLITEATNWVGDVTPPNIQQVAQPGTLHELHFGPSAFTFVDGGAVQDWASDLIFDSGAPAYTLGSAGGEYAFPNIINNSSNLQTIAMHINSQNKIIKTTSTGGLAFTTGYLYGNSTSQPIQFQLTSTVTFSGTSRMAAGSPRNVYGTNGTATVVSDATGILELNSPTGTGTTANTTNFTGQVNIWSGAVRVGNALALGATNNTARNTYIHGTFPASAASTAQLSGGYEHGFGSLQLQNGITLTERVRWDSRVGDAADFDHVVNVSGNNQLGTGTANTGINQMGGAGHYNVNSLAGKITFGSALDMHVSDGAHTDSTSGINSIFTFRGAGDIEMQGRVGQESGMAGAMTGLEGTVTTLLRKQGGGVLTLSSPTNDWDGGTVIQGGSIVAPLGGSFSTGGTKVHIASGASLDVSAIGGVSLAAGKTLSGSGSVLGNVTLGGSIDPGGIDSLDGADALVVSASAGILSLNNDLNVNTGSTFNYDLDPLNPGSVADDALNVNGLLNFVSSPGVTVNVSTAAFGGSNLFGGDYLLVDYGTIGGSIPSITINAPLFGGSTASIIDTGSALYLHVVPEPSTYLLAALGMAGFSGYGLRRRRKAS